MALWASLLSLTPLFMPVILLTPLFMPVISLLWGTFLLLPQIKNVEYFTQDAHFDNRFVQFIIKWLKFYMVILGYVKQM